MYAPTPADWDVALERATAAVGSLYEDLVPREDALGYGLAHLAEQAGAFDPSRASWADYAGAKAYYGAINGIRAEVGRTGSPRLAHCERTYPLSSLSPAARAALAAPEPGPDEALADADAAAFLDRCLALLDDRSRYVVEQTYYEGRTLGEVGDSLNLTTARVCQIRQAALLSLRGPVVDGLG